MTERITSKDLARALEAHVDCLARVGITYDGRLGLEEGSKTYGRAYRLYLTGKHDRCQERRYRETSTGDLYRWPEDAPTGRDGCELVRDWDHVGCDRCDGTKLEVSSGHYRPPVGDDYLGGSAREAYNELTSRTRTIYDAAHALEQSKVNATPGLEG
jgi:hypothetical protein